MLPVGRSPNVVKRSNCELGSLGSYFFLLLFAWRTRLMTATMSVQNWKISSHVTSITVTPSLTIGGKRSISPPKRFEGTAYRGTDSTWNSVAQDMTDCKQKTVFSEVEDISAICKRAAALCRAQPPKAALSESQRGLHTQFTNKPLRLTFVRHLSTVE